MSRVGVESEEFSLVCDDDPSGFYGFAAEEGGMVESLFGFAVCRD